MIGLISIIAAPVVPISEASRVPMARRHVLTIGVPARCPLTCTPPATVNNAKSRIINGMYSDITACMNCVFIMLNPNTIQQGIKKAAAQKTDTFPKLCSQKCGTKRGPSAIESNMQANGITQMIESCEPSKCPSDANAGEAYAIITPSKARNGKKKRFIDFSPNKTKYILRAKI